VIMLVRYLIEVKTSLKENELDRLRGSKAFPKEVSIEASSALGIAESAHGAHYCVTELYEPSDELRRLGLPIIAWETSSKWTSDSDTGGRASLFPRYTYMIIDVPLKQQRFFFLWDYVDIHL
jgi:hypothetical protein